MLFPRLLASLEHIALSEHRWQRCLAVCSRKQRFRLHAFSLSPTQSRTTAVRSREHLFPSCECNRTTSPFWKCVAAHFAFQYGQWRTLAKRSPHLVRVFGECLFEFTRKDTTTQRDSDGRFSRYPFRSRFDTEHLRAFSYLHAPTVWRSFEHVCSSMNDKACVIFPLIGD